MILLAVQHHPDLTLVKLGLKLVRRIAHEPLLSGVGASGNLGWFTMAGYNAGQIPAPP